MPNYSFGLNNNLDIVTKCREISLGRASYSLWTNLVGRKSGTSKVTWEESKNQMSHTWIFG